MAKRKPPAKRKARAMPNIPPAMFGGGPPPAPSGMGAPGMKKGGPVKGKKK